MKDPHAVALGRKAKGKPKTLTPASIVARQANAAKGRAVMKARREAARENISGDSHEAVLHD
jgi:hypothetical protein